MNRMKSNSGEPGGFSGNNRLESGLLTAGIVGNLTGVLKSLQQAAERLAGTGVLRATPAARTTFPVPGSIPSGQADPGPAVLSIRANADFLNGLAEIERRYQEMRNRVSAGNAELLAGFLRTFEQLKSGGREAFESLSERFESLTGTLNNNLGDYASNLGAVSGFASKAFTAFRALNPFAAAFAAVGLSALGQMLRRLSSGGSGKSGASSGSFSLGTGSSASTGTNAGNDSWRGPQVVNVYIDGLRNSSPQELDRSLGRAGVDRELRQRIRELVRSGSNPVRIA